MDKRGVLISRLQEQYQQGAEPSSLLNTALLLVSELQSSEVPEAIPASGKVSVIMPVRLFEITIAAEHYAAEKQEETAEPTPATADKTLSEVFETNILPEAEASPPAEELVLEETADDISEEITEETFHLPEPEPMQTSGINTLVEEKYNDVLEAIPTLAQQQPKMMFELNDTMQPEEPSINDKLKQQAPEITGSLHNEPIKDLRKAIGINDKYVFMRELFRNDEAAYERTLKTINGFNILPEAEYWIQREMKYKLGWDDNNPTVKAFYQLVRRRFS